MTANELLPDTDRLSALAAKHDAPVQMVNLLKFRETAEYPSTYDGNKDRDVSGERAYNRYAERALAHIMKRGGRILLVNEVDMTVVGDDQGWDRVAIVEYPTRAAFLDMAADPDYQSGLVHRDAGLERTVIIATEPLPGAPRSI